MYKIRAIFKNIPLWLVTLILTVPTFYLLTRPGFFSMQDDLQAFRLHQIHKCFLDFQLPCRWVPDAGYMYGYPMFNFYSPSVFYLGEIFHLLGFQIIDSVKLLFILGFVLSTLAMYILLRAFFNGFASVVGAVIFSYVPLRATQVYVRGSLNEFWSQVFFPLLFWSSYQFLVKKKMKFLYLFSVFTGLLLLTHNLMSFIFFFCLGLWIMVHSILLKNLKGFVYLFLGGLLGFGLAAFFVIPMVTEGRFVHLESLIGGYFDYRQHFVTVKELFFSNQFGYGSSVLGPVDDLSLSTGIFIWPVSLLGFILSIINYRRNKKLSVLIIILSFLALGSLFLMHQRSSFIWERVTLLHWLQFPWRLLNLSVFLLNFIAVAVFYYINKKAALFFGILLILLSVVYQINFFKPKDWFYISDQEKFSGLNWEKQLTISIFEYLPKTATLPPNKKAQDLPEVLEGKVEFLSFKKSSNYQQMKVMVNEDSVIRLQLIDFPGLQVKLNGKEHDFVNNDCRGQEYCFGLVTIKAPAGEYIIEAGVKNTLVRTLSNIFSLFSFLTLIVFIFKYAKN